MSCSTIVHTHTHTHTHTRTAYLCTQCCIMCIYKHITIQYNMLSHVGQYQAIFEYLFSTKFSFPNRCSGSIWYLGQRAVTIKQALIFFILLLVISISISTINHSCLVHSLLLVAFSEIISTFSFKKPLFKLNI